MSTRGHFLPDNTLVLAARAADVAGISIRYPFLDRQMVESRDRDTRVTETARTNRDVRTAPHADTAAALAPAATGAAGTAAASMALRRLDDAGAQDAARPAVRRPGNRVRPALRQLWDEHMTSRADHSRRLWALLMLEFWFRDFIDGDAAAEPLEYAVLVKAA